MRKRTLTHLISNPHATRTAAPAADRAAPHSGGIFFFLTPLLLVELYAFSLGVAFILATIYVRFRDIAPIWEVFLQIGMYLTPIIYPVTLVMQKSTFFAKLFLLNPMAQIIQDMRYLLTSKVNITVWQMINHKWIVAIPYIIPFIVLAYGYYVFKKNSKKFAEII